MSGADTPWSIRRTCTLAIGRVRRVAVIGAVGLPACWVAYSLMSGPIWQYFAINVAVIALGVTTTPAIYSRIVATRFQKARGLALAVAISGPPLLGAISAPALDAINRSYGWRVGCLAIAFAIGVIGAIAILLIPPEDRAVERARRERKARNDYRAMGSSPVFWILLSGVLLCNLYHTVTTSQLGVVLGGTRLFTRCRRTVVTVAARRVRSRPSTSRR